MARLETTLARALILYLALLPLLGAAAEVRGEPQVVDTPRPFDPPRPTDPGRPQDDKTIFTPSAEPVTIRAFNGFSSHATAGQHRHLGHAHPGGIVSFDSPWGERLDVRYWTTPHGLTFEYDGDLKVRYRFDDTGTLAEIVAETPEREARMPVGNRAELAYLGQRELSSFDMSAYLLIDESLQAKHSEAFLSGLARFDGPAEASCVIQAIQCGACVVAWAATVFGISSACLVGGVPTFGLSCLAAILAHEATNFSCAATCAAWAGDCLRVRPDGEPIPDGCEP